MEVRDEAGKQLVGPEQSKAAPQPEASTASRASKLGRASKPPCWADWRKELDPESNLPCLANKLEGLRTSAAAAKTCRIADPGRVWTRSSATGLPLHGQAGRPLFPQPSHFCKDVPIGADVDHWRVNRGLLTRRAPGLEHAATPSYIIQHTTHNAACRVYTTGWRTLSSMSRQRGLLPSGRTRNRRNQRGGEPTPEVRSAWGKDVPRNVCKIVVWCGVRGAWCAVLDTGNIEHHQPHRSAASAPPAQAATRLIGSP